MHVIQRKYPTHVSHPESANTAFSSEHPVEWVPRQQSPQPLGATPSSSALPQTARSSVQSPSPSIKALSLSAPGDDSTNPVLPVATSDPPQHSDPALTRALPELPPPELPSASGPGQSTDEEAALLLRLYHLQVPAPDIARVMAAMRRGHAESSIEEARLMWRLQNFDVMTEDITLIVDAMRRRSQQVRVTRNNADRQPDPPPRYYLGL
jgi:hypothetical protein